MSCDLMPLQISGGVINQLFVQHFQMAKGMILDSLKNHISRQKQNKLTVGFWFNWYKKDSRKLGFTDKKELLEKIHFYKQYI